MRAALDLGVNTIKATAEIYSAEDGTFEHPQVVTSPPVGITREPGPRTGELDLATALMVAEDHSDVYWLCGEADACLATAYCVRVSQRRVDCPVKSRFQPGDPVGCGVVVSVQVRGRNVRSYSYRCDGRWRRTTKVRSFVRPSIARVGRRYRIDVRDAPWLSDEINAPNRYGVPRFDLNRNQFIP